MSESRHLWIKISEVKRTKKVKASCIPSSNDSHMTSSLILSVSFPIQILTAPWSIDAHTEVAIIGSLQGETQKSNLQVCLAEMDRPAGLL